MARLFSLSLLSLHLSRCFCCSTVRSRRRDRQEGKGLTWGTRRPGEVGGKTPREAGQGSLMYRTRPRDLNPVRTLFDYVPIPRPSIPVPCPSRDAERERYIPPVSLVFLCIIPCCSLVLEVLCTYLSSSHLPCCRVPIVTVCTVSCFCQHHAWHCSL